MAWVASWPQDRNPWHSDEWLALLKIDCGPNPSNGAELPPFMTEEDAQNVREYIEHFADCKTMKVARTKSLAYTKPGRDVFKKWWNKVWTKCRGNQAVDRILHDGGLDAAVVLRGNGYSKVPVAEDVPEASFLLARELFGPVTSCNPITNTIKKEIIQVSNFFQGRSYERNGRAMLRGLDKLSETVMEIEEIINSECTSLTPDMTLTFLGRGA
jgi:hypothetical protein